MAQGSFGESRPPHVRRRDPFSAARAGLLAEPLPSLRVRPHRPGLLAGKRKERERGRPFRWGGSARPARPGRSSPSRPHCRIVASFGVVRPRPGRPRRERRWRDLLKGASETYCGTSPLPTSAAASTPLLGRRFESPSAPRRRTRSRGPERGAALSGRRRFVGRAGRVNGRTPASARAGCYLLLATAAPARYRTTAVQNLARAPALPPRPTKSSGASAGFSAAAIPVADDPIWTRKPTGAKGRPAAICARLDALDV